MRKLLIIILLGIFAVWIYRVPMDGRLPVLPKLRSNIVMNLTSNTFTNNGMIPARYTCTGQNINPHLDISGIPEGTRSLVLIMDDPTAPNGINTHWVVYNIPPETKSIPEGQPILGIHAKNSAGENKYSGPCPSNGIHRYYFKLYALDSMVDSSVVTNKGQLLREMKGRILEQTELIGRYGSE